ncbi:hypothetical protein [Streptomyces sp. NPDC001787]|uniref:hypothetical protein n=1 Tax=Streptomyces sp. NPDC001787 TaxID=3154523 RepID=UPI003320F0E4
MTTGQGPELLAHDRTATVPVPLINQVHRIHLDFALPRDGRQSITRSFRPPRPTRDRSTGLEQ